MLLKWRGPNGATRFWSPTQARYTASDRPDDAGWDTAQLLASTTFKCTGSDAAKPAATNDHAVVLLADFYRAGDGVDESFTAQMIVSETDIAPEIPGNQNLWVQGVGCGCAVVHFSN